MGFETPGLLWWLLATPLVLLFGLWRTRPATVTVPSLRLWVRLKERNPPLRELRRPAFHVSLLLQAMAAAALVAALAGPRHVEPRTEPRSLFLLLDDSASLGARDASGRARWDLAREAVRSIAGRVSPGDRLVVAAGHSRGTGDGPPRYDGPPGGVAAWLETQEPSGCGEEAIVRAARLLAAECGTGPGRAMVVVSDRRAASVAAAVEAARGACVTVGGPVSNAGILAFSAEPAGAGGCEVFLSLAGPPGVELDVELDALSDMTTPPRGLARVRVPLDRHGDGTALHRLVPGPAEPVLRARLAGPDALEADDVAFAVRAASGPDLVCFSARPANLVRAMQSIPGLSVEVIAAEAGRPAPAHPGARLAVYDGVVPERIPEGQWIVLADPPASAGPFEIGEAGPAGVDAWRVAPPLTDHVDLPSIGVRAARSCRIRETGAGTVRAILESRERGPLLAWWDRPGGGVVYAGFDTVWRGDPGSSATSWALDPSFPIFWANVADAARGGAAGGGSWTSGRTCEPVEVPGRDGARATRGRLHRPGPVLGGAGGRAIRGAVGLFDAVETSCGTGGGVTAAGWRLPDPEPGRRAVSLTGGFAAGAGLLLMAGWLLSSRTG